MLSFPYITLLAWCGTSLAVRPKTRLAYRLADIPPQFGLKFGISGLNVDIVLCSNSSRQSDAL